MWSVVAISTIYAAVGIFALGFAPNGRVFAELSCAQKSLHPPSSTRITIHFCRDWVHSRQLALSCGSIDGGSPEPGHLLRLKIAALIDTTGGQGALPLASGVRNPHWPFAYWIERRDYCDWASVLWSLLALNVRRENDHCGMKRRHGVIFAGTRLVVAVVFVGFSDVFVGRIGAAWGLRAGPLTFLCGNYIVDSDSTATWALGMERFLQRSRCFMMNPLGIWSFWDKAHNTYLETFQGLGLLFGGMLIASVVVLVWDCLKGARTRQRRRNNSGNCGERFGSGRRACARRFQSTNSGCDIDLHGHFRGRRGTGKG